MHAGVADLRAMYLFGLAHLCGCPAPVVDELALDDFAIYIDSIDAWARANSERG